MNIEKYDGTEQQVGGATIEDIEAAIKEVNVKRVTVYKPGDEVVLQSGAQYRVGPKGNWIRLNK
jgi:hypothetical protein